MNPLTFFKCLSDDTRLKSLLLMQQTGDVCVCDLMHALDADQPKISRHLADLRKCQIVQDQRRGKWVFYNIHPQLPDWARQVLNLSATDNPGFLKEALTRLKAQQICC